MRCREKIIENLKKDILEGKIVISKSKKRVALYDFQWFYFHGFGLNEKSVWENIHVDYGTTESTSKLALYTD